MSSYIDCHIHFGYKVFFSSIRAAYKQGALHFYFFTSLEGCPIDDAQFFFGHTFLTEFSFCIFFLFCITCTPEVAGVTFFQTPSCSKIFESGSGYSSNLRIRLRLCVSGLCRITWKYFQLQQNCLHDVLRLRVQKEQSPALVTHGWQKSKIC